MKNDRGGQINIGGINSQMWAAMSLFLQFLRNPNFLHIHLEAPGFQDFNLVFNDGKKIICESKDRNGAFSYGDLKKLLKKVSATKNLSQNDEILVICKKASPKLVEDVKYAKYFPEIKRRFKAKGYTDAQINLLDYVEFWVVPPSFNEQIIYSLFTDLINFWIPVNELERIVDNILLQRIYKGSARGAIYSKADLVKEINALAEEAKDNSTFYNDALEKREDQFSRLESALTNPQDKTWNISKELSAFSTDYEKLKFATTRLSSRVNVLNLPEWDSLWQLNKVYFFTFGIFDIFENNLHTKANQDYVINYIKKYTKTVRSFYQPDFFNIDLLKILNKIVDGVDGSDYLEEVFGITSDLIAFDQNEFFYKKEDRDGHDQWEKGETCKLIHKIYNHPHAGPKLKQKIFDVLVATFNLIEDQGEFSIHTPAEAFSILANWLQEDFEDRFGKIVKVLINQYDKYYRQFGKKLYFAGWEHMGGGISFHGGYHASDRHFIGVLAPAIRNYYSSNPDAAWRFIKEKCISTTTQVNKNRPDFLNRCVYEIVLERYAQDDQHISDEAFKILREFVLSRRGIPHKSDLIYQAARNLSVTDEKKWKLVELTTSKYGVPVNPFAEQIVTALARNGFISAREELKRWFAEPKYYQRFMFGEDAVSSIKILLESDFDFAIELFETLLKSPYFRDGKSDSLSPFKVAEILQQILNTSYPKGLRLLRSLESENILTRDQQSIYCFSLFNNKGNDDSDDPYLLSRVYSDVVDPLLNAADNNAKELFKRISSDGARAAIVQFAVRLAVKKKMAEAIRIVKVFVDDPDPYLTNLDPNDPKNEYNEHKRIEDGEAPRSITSVRGWCGWALMKCAILEGRDYIPEIIALTKKLAGDENYYVVHMATFALSQLARNRLTVLPDNRTTLFFDDNREVALKMAKEVESIAFSLLDRLLTWPEKVQTAMCESVLHVLDPIRSLNETDSLRLANNLVRLPRKAINESAPLLIYLAEFRKDAYKKWQFSAPGLYDELSPEKFDSKKFKKILLETVGKIQKENPDDCFRFAASVEHLMREAGPQDDEVKRYTELALEYFGFLTNVYGHHIFNLVYMTIQSKLERPDAYLDQWFALLIKCFEVESSFYEEAVKTGNVTQVRWYPALYHSRVLELVHERFSNDKFMQATKMFFGFPRVLDLNESDGLISIIRDIAKTDEEAKEILKSLFSKSPSKYWHLKNELQDE